METVTSNIKYQHEYCHCEQNTAVSHGAADKANMTLRLIHRLQIKTHTRRLSPLWLFKMANLCFSVV